MLSTEGNDEELQDEADIKIILLGDTAVGKTKLVERYLKNDYNPRQVRVFIFKKITF